MDLESRGRWLLWALREVFRHDRTLLLRLRLLRLRLMRRPRCDPPLADRLRRGEADRDRADRERDCENFLPRRDPRLDLDRDLDRDRDRSDVAGLGRLFLWLAWLLLLLNGLGSRSCVAEREDP